MPYKPPSNSTRAWLLFMHRQWKYWVLCGLVVIAYFIAAKLLHFQSFPILTRPGGLISLPDWELKHRIEMGTSFLRYANCPCYMNPTKPSAQQLYAYVTEENLPWLCEQPARLIQLQDEFSADKLVTAFRTILPDPLYAEEDNIAVAATYLAGTVLLPGETASLNAIIGPYTTERGYKEGPTYMGSHIVGTVAGGVCKVASTLYNVIIASDLQVIERHPHSMMVPYVPPGRDATVAWGSKDFRFRNNRDTPVAFWATSSEGVLYIAMYGQFIPPQVEWHHQELARRPTWTIRRKNPALPKGATRLTEGYDAVTVRTWITVKYPNQRSERRDLGIEHYRAMPHILEFGP